RLLVGVPNIVSELIQNVQVVIRIRSLKPRPAVVQVEVNRILLRKLIVHAIKNILLVSFVVEDQKLRWIKKTARLQSACRNEVAPAVATIAKIKTCVGRSEGAKGAVDAARRLLHSLTGTSRNLDDETRFIPVFSGRGTVNHFKRLDRFCRNLV